jgi:hypothetical protein
MAFLIARSPAPCTFFEPVDLHDQLTDLALQFLLLLLLLTPLADFASSTFKSRWGGLQHLGFPLGHLHRVKVMVRSDLGHCLDPFDRLQGDPCLELGTVLPSLSLTHSVSLVGFGFPTHETSTQANLTPGSVSPRPLIELVEAFNEFNLASSGET